MTLLVCPEEDHHGIAVGAQLTRRGVPWHRLAAGDFATNKAYAIDPLREDFGRSHWCESLREWGSDGKEAHASGPLASVYWRRVIRKEEALKETHPVGSELAVAEAMAAFRLALAALPVGLFPLGHPDALRRGENKLLQLRLAREVGFAVPETRVGNDPVILQEMASKHRKCVVKPLRHGVVHSVADRAQTEQLLWCREVPTDRLCEHFAKGRSAQMMIQEAVSKVADWRVTVLPHITICCEIDTSGLPAGEPDWRKRVHELPHRIIELPAEFERLLRAYLLAIGLPAGYFDFAVTEEGVPFFLEMNTNAQWLWIEQRTGFSISSEIAEALIAPAEPLLARKAATAD